MLNHKGFEISKRTTVGVSSEVWLSKDIQMSCTTEKSWLMQGKKCYVWSPYWFGLEKLFCSIKWWSSIIWFIGNQVKWSNFVIKWCILLFKKWVEVVAFSFKFRKKLVIIKVTLEVISWYIVLFVVCFFNRFFPVEKCRVTPRCLYRDSLTLIRGLKCLYHNKVISK